MISGPFYPLLPAPPLRGKSEPPLGIIASEIPCLKVPHQRLYSKERRRLPFLAFLSDLLSLFLLESSEEREREGGGAKEGTQKGESAMGGTTSMFEVKS